MVGQFDRLAGPRQRLYPGAFGNQSHVGDLRGEHRCVDVSDDVSPGPGVHGLLVDQRARRTCRHRNLFRLSQCGRRHHRHRDIHHHGRIRAPRHDRRRTGGVLGRQAGGHQRQLLDHVFRR